MMNAICLVYSPSSAIRYSSIQFQVDAANQGGQGESIYQRDRVFALLYRLDDGRPGKVACRDDCTPSERL